MIDNVSSTDPKAATRLAILGVVCRAPTLGTMIVTLVKHIVGRAWHPTSDVIAQNLEELRNRALVRAGGDGRRWDTTSYEITDEGRALLDSLLRRPIEATASGIDPGAVALKVCFLDLLEPAAQREQIEGILALYDVEIGRFREAVMRCACDWAYVADWIELEIRRLTAEREWFEELTGRLREASPAV